MDENETAEVVFDVGGNRVRFETGASLASVEVTVTRGDSRRTFELDLELLPPFKRETRNAAGEWEDVPDAEPGELGRVIDPSPFGMPAERHGGSKPVIIDRN